MLYCGLPITISGKDYVKGQTNPGTSQVDRVGAADPIETKTKPVEIEALEPNFFTEFPLG